MTISARRQAQIDIAATDPRGLEGIHDVNRARSIFRQVAIGMKPATLIELMVNSANPDALLHELLKIKEFLSRDQLQEFVELLYIPSNNQIFSDALIQELVERYWRLCVTVRLDRSDYRRAWDEVKRALGGPEGDTASYLVTANPSALIELVFKFMKGKDLVSEITEDFIPAPDHVPYLYGTGSLYWVSKVAGWKIVLETGNATNEQGVNRTGQMILAIARVYRDEQKTRRRRKKNKS